MTDNNETNESAGVPEIAGEEQRAPKRVIGTPPSVEGPGLVAAVEQKEETGYVLDEAKARRAERVVASFFMLTFVAGVAFMFFYGWWPGTAGTLNRAERSNYFLGSAMTLAFSTFFSGGNLCSSSSTHERLQAVVISMMPTPIVAKYACCMRPNEKEISHGRVSWQTR